MGVTMGQEVNADIQFNMHIQKLIFFSKSIVIKKGRMFRSLQNAFTSSHLKTLPSGKGKCGNECFFQVRKWGSSRWSDSQLR